MLSFRPETRKRKARAGNGVGSISGAAQAALIVELIELGLVRVVPKPKAFTHHTFSLRQKYPTPTGNGPLDAMLGEIGQPGRESRTLRDWVSTSSIGDTVIGDLVARGIVVESYATFGPLFRNYRVEPVDLALDTELREHFHAVFMDGADATERDCLLAAVLADGYLWEYYAPLRGHDAQMRFLSRVNTLAERRRPSRGSLKLGEGDDITLVLTALAHSNV